MDQFNTKWINRKHTHQDGDGYLDIKVNNTDHVSHCICKCSEADTEIWPPNFTASPENLSVR